MDLGSLLGVIRRRALVLALCVIAGAVGGIQLARSTPEQYRATARALVALPPTEQARDTGQQLAGSQLSASLVPTYADISTSRTVAGRVVQQLGLGMTVGEMQGRLSAVQQPETLIINISATDGDPVRAASIADATAQALSDRVAELNRGSNSGVQVRVLDRAEIPGAPFEPRPRIDLALGLVLGLALGAALAAALEALDRTIKGPAQLSELSQAPLLGMIPRMRARASQPEATVDNPMSPEAEAYRALRTALRFIDVESPLQTVLITSAGPSEGKTTTATHFAIALAQSGERVVLVDGDLRRGSLLDNFGLPSGGGVTSVVTGAASVDDVVQVWRDLVAVVGTGPLPPNPAEILGSTAMATLLDDLRGYADIIVIDAPPVLPVTDAVALSTQVDGVVIVGRDGKTSRNNVAEARRRLEGVGAHVVGCVLNGVRSKGELYADYRYLSPVVETPSLGRRLSDRLRH